jgi:hypothetical protein
MAPALLWSPRVPQNRFDGPRKVEQDGGEKDASMADIPTRVKRLLREFAGKAHEAELREALEPLAEAFKRWERNELDSFELSDLIHRFHQGPARDIYVRYTNNYLKDPVASAIASGLIDRATVPAELLDHLANLIQIYEEHREA